MFGFSSSDKGTGTKPGERIQSYVSREGSSSTRGARVGQRIPFGRFHVEHVREARLVKVSGGFHVKRTGRSGDRVREVAS